MSEGDTVNAPLARLCSLLLLTAACSAPTVQQKDDAINAALVSARVACATALKDSSYEFAPGAREYCQFIVEPHECRP